MRANQSRFLAAAICSATILFPACNDSNAVTAPGGMTSSLNVAGSWSGDFVSDSALCAGSPASATFTQEGTRVQGSFTAAACGIKGVFHGYVTGTHLMGTVDMLGCTGGAVSASMTDAGLRLTVGEFKKELVTGDAEVHAGGVTTLHR